MDQPPVEVVEIATNVDDASAEVIGAATEALLEEGALDVWTAAIGMKRGRPGVMVSLLCERKDQPRLSRRVIELTGSFGVRFRPWGRVVLDRRHRTVQTEYGAVRVKVGSLDGEVVVSKPEFQDAAMAAKRHGVSVRRVIEAARAAMHEAPPGEPD